MLSLRPGCECCNKDLPPDEAGAYICTYECTYCAACAEEKLGFTCKNCGGELVARPRRPTAKLAKDPASTKRVYNPQGCGDRGKVMNSEALA